MARPGKNEKVKRGTGIYKRARKRARAQGEWKDVRQGGVTFGEARGLRPDKPDKPRKSGAVRRTEERVDYLRDHGGIPGGVNPRGGYNKRERGIVRRAWKQERRYDPNVPRGGRALLEQAEALTDQRYGPLENELGRERQYEQGRQNVLFGPGGWFQGYSNDIAAAAQRQQAADAAFQAGAIAASQQAFNLGMVQNAQAGQQAGQVAAVGGGQIDPNVAAMADQAAAGRANQASNFAGTIGQIGQANTQHMNSLAMAATQQGQEGLMNSQARMAKVDQLARELAVERGDYKTGKVGELMDAEHTKQMERRAFGLDVLETQAGIAEDRADARGERAEARMNRRQKKRQKRANRRLQDMPNPRSLSADRRKRWDRIVDLSDDGQRNQSKSFKSYADQIYGDAWDNERDSGGGGGSSGPGGSGSGGGDFTPLQLRNNREALRNIIHRSKEGLDIPDSTDPLMLKVAAYRAKGVAIPSSLRRRFKKAYGFNPGGGKRRSNRQTLDTPGNAPGGLTTNTNTRGGDTSRPN
jgi:hypothetical protein